MIIYLFCPSFDLKTGGGASATHSIRVFEGIIDDIEGSDRKDMVISSAVPPPNECPVTIRL